MDVSTIGRSASLLKLCSPMMARKERKTPIPQENPSLHLGPSARDILYIPVQDEHLDRTNAVAAKRREQD